MDAIASDLRAFADTVVRCDDVDELLARGLEQLTRLVQCNGGQAMLVDGDALVVRAAEGAWASQRGRRLSLRDVPAVVEALADQMLHMNVDAPLARTLVVPLCVGDRCFGVVTLDGEQCSAAHMDALQVAARILALAFDKKHTTHATHTTLDVRPRRVPPLPSYDAGVVARSPAMRDVVERAQKVARTSTPVLLLGETGTGKERLARAIHQWSGRSGPFVAVNCAAIPAGLLESELFGHVRGAFSGAVRDRAGRFVAAAGGTLLLDEIGDLPLELQPKLLRALQEGEVEPVGSDKPVRVSCRVIAATHVDLARAAAEGRFRDDLRFRLSVFPLSLPALRARRDDLRDLVDALLAEQAARTGLCDVRVLPAALAKIEAHAWPGNVRELANVLERAAILANGGSIGAEHIVLEPRVDAATCAPRSGTLDDAVRAAIVDALARCDGRVYGEDGAAKLLGVPPSTLQHKMKRLGIVR